MSRRKVQKSVEDIKERRVPKFYDGYERKRWSKLPKLEKTGRGFVI